MFTAEYNLAVLKCGAGKVPCCVCCTIVDKNDALLFAYMCLRTGKPEHISAVPSCTSSECMGAIAVRMEKAYAHHPGGVYNAGRRPSVAALGDLEAVFNKRMTFIFGDSCSNCGYHNYKVVGEQHCAFRKCSGCRRVTYCNVECQHAHWSNHKAFCKANRAHKPDARATDHTLVSPDAIDKWIAAHSINPWPAPEIAVAAARYALDRCCGRQGCKNRLLDGDAGIVKGAHPWGFCGGICMLRITAEIGPREHPANYPVWESKPDDLCDFLVAIKKILVPSDNPAAK